MINPNPDESSLKSQHETLLPRLFFILLLLFIYVIFFGRRFQSKEAQDFICRHPGMVMQQKIKFWLLYNVPVCACGVKVACLRMAEWMYANEEIKSPVGERPLWLLFRWERNFFLSSVEISDSLLKTKTL